VSPECAVREENGVVFHLVCEPYFVGFEPLWEFFAGFGGSREVVVFDVAEVVEV